MAAGSAAKEVRQQLQAQGGSGKVWVDGWGRKYEAELGSLKDFLSSRSEFQIHPAGGNRFTVSMRGAAAKGKGASKGKGGVASQALAALTNSSSRGPPKGAGKSGGGHSLASGKNVGIAIQEIRSQLEEQGGSGKVFIGNWKEIEGELGPLRDFIESRPDKFVMHPGVGRAFTVSLAGAGGGWGSGAQKQQARAVPAQASQKSGGYDRSVAEAIREIRQQLELQGGAGEVWVDNWMARFASLGTTRAFLESRPDKFTVIPGAGRKFTVALNNAGGKGGAQKRSPASSGFPTPVAKKAKTAKASDDDLEGQLIAEITAQLMKANSAGKVWVNGWNGRYGKTFGTLREFLDSRPDTFDVTEGEGTRFTVSLV